VRNPLFSLSATLDAFEARTQNQAEHAPYTDVLRSEIKRLSRLMNELLEYGKPFSLNLSPCQLREVIEEAVTNCRRTQKKMDVTIDNQVSRHLPEINVDRQRLKQVFQNLIDNALQHSPDQGVITITASLVEGESGSRMELCVCDHGSGFQNEDLSRILEPFFSRRKGGTGLGLSIVQRFIEAHGGTVTAGNRPAGGAVITVTIPMNLKS
jgi:signal transduction histidine kinase